MSTQYCGCDPEAGWTCDTHREIAASMERFKARLAAEQQMKDAVSADATRLALPPWRATEGCGCDRCRTALAARVVEATPLEEQCIDTQRVLGQLDAELRTLVQRAAAMQAENDRLRAQVPPSERMVRRCAAVLATFYRAPLSLSSVQPLLTLAEELNPSLEERA